MPNDFPDRRRAILRAPLHVLLSVPFALGSIVKSDVGEDYIEWRTRAEKDDFNSGRDSARKAKVDLVTQTALVRGVLKIKRWL